MGLMKACAAVSAAAALAISCGGIGSITERSDIAVLCTEAAVKPATPIPAGTRICNDVTTGNLALSADFTTNSSSDQLVEAYPGANVTDLHGAASFENGTAVIHSTGSRQEADVAPRGWLEAAPPLDVVLVVDFKGLAQNSTLGFTPRCSKDACSLVAIDGDGKFRFSVRNGRSWSYPLKGDLNGDTGYPAPRLNQDGENRLIVWSSQGKMDASLNGRWLGTIDLKSAAAREAFMFFRSVNPNQSTQVALTRIFFFEAGR